MVLGSIPSASIFFFFLLKARGEGGLNQTVLGEFPPCTSYSYSTPNDQRPNKLVGDRDFQGGRAASPNEIPVPA